MCVCPTGQNGDVSGGETAESRDMRSLDSGGFSDVPLGSPPQRLSQNLSNGNSTKPGLEQVARSLAHQLDRPRPPPGDIDTDWAKMAASEQLRAENMQLKERLRAVENVSPVSQKLNSKFEACSA